VTVLRPGPDSEPTEDPGPDLLDLDDHLLGRVEGDPSAVTVIMVGGLHGNEPAGVRAILSVFERLERERLAPRASLYGLAGNLPALRSGTRFVESDLNRMWGGAGRDDGAADGRSRRALEGHMEAALSRARGPVVLLDLHSTSSGGAPFSIVANTPENRRLARSFPVPLVLGLEESVEGTLLTFFGRRGHAAIGFEGGAHDDPLTVEHHTAAIWLTLLACGALWPEAIGDLAGHRRRLRHAARGLPPVVEVSHRHPVRPDDRFRMAPGYANFGPVSRGEVIAHDAAGAIASPADGLLLLPLYQGEGEDGFFIGRSVPRAFLLAERVLRWFGSER
jgi:succinylglutamate desuccinylase